MICTGNEIKQMRRLLGRRESTAAAVTSATIQYNHLPDWLTDLFKAANVSGLGQKITIIRALSIAGLAAVLSIAAGAPVLLGLSAVWILIELALLKARALKRTQIFERDYTAFLLSLASAIRTGMDPLDAMRRSGELFPAGSVLQQELKLSLNSLDNGQSEEAFISAFAQAVPHPDLPLFRTAFLLSRRQGTSLSGCLHRLVRVTRSRQSFRRKIRAALAMQRLSALGIACCALIIGLIQFLSNPESLRLAAANPFGVKLLVLGSGLISGGLVWMLYVSRNKI